MMILVGYWGSPFARRVGVAMKLLGMPFELRATAPSTHGPALRRVNPVGRVPALILDDGEVLIDSAMILDYLDEAAGDRALTPPRGPERRRCNRVVALALGACEKYVATYYEGSKRPPEKLHQPWRDHLDGQVATALAALEAEAAGAAPWFLGARLTQADIATACAVLSMRFDMPVLAPPGRYPHLDALVDRADALAAFRETAP